MRKLFYLLLISLFLLCGCSENNASGKNYRFTQSESGNYVSGDGVEYAHLANEGILYYLGNLEFCGSIQGEEKRSSHLGLPYQTGMFSIKEAPNDNILIRRVPDNEWFAIYRKASLPEFDFSADRCVRLEFFSNEVSRSDHSIHITCGDGITDQAAISAFLSEVRSQESPQEAGLYELIKKPDGMLENCYVYGVIYGFFQEEPNLVLRMDITSYNDLAYSVSIDNREYVLPTQWLERLQDPNE